MNEDFTTVGSWCDEAGATFLVGDPNGDQHDDWICHHPNGTVCTKYNSYIFAGKEQSLDTTIQECQSTLEIL